MDFTLLCHVNYLPVAASAIALFFLGAIWFSVLFAKAWVHELSLHNVIIPAPSQSKIVMSMGLSLVKNIVISLAMACLVTMVGSTTFASGLTLGLLVAVGFAATAVADVFIWESRSVKLFLIDAGYQMACVIVSAIILSVWH